MQPIRRKLEPGSVDRVDQDGHRLGLEVYFKDAGGKPRRRAVKGDVHAARDLLAEARTRRVKRDREPLNPRVTFAAVCDEFERAHVAALRPNSRVNRRAALKRLRARFGSQRISEISRADVRAWVADMTGEDDLKANTIRSYYSVLRKVFAFAADDLDMPARFPALKPSELPDPADDAREHRILTDDELAAVLDACDPSTRLYFQTLAETGARASEALGLIPRRVGDATITFAQQRGPDGRLAPLKSRHSRRQIEVRRALAAQLRLAGSERVFGRLTLGAVERAWRQALERAQLEGPQPVLHDLRHSHASKLIATGWDPVQVAGRLGDRIETVLAVYLHDWDAQRSSAERHAAVEAMYSDVAPAVAGKLVEFKR